MVQSLFVTRRMIATFVALVILLGCLALIATPALAQTTTTVQQVGNTTIITSVNSQNGTTNQTTMNSNGTKTSTTYHQDGSSTTTFTNKDGTTTTVERGP